LKEKIYLYYYDLIMFGYLRIFEVVEFESDNLKIRNSASIMANQNLKKLKNIYLTYIKNKNDFFIELLLNPAFC